jgi:hypothetical protein
MCILSTVLGTTLGTVLGVTLAAATIGTAVAGGVVATVAGVQEAKNRQAEAEYMAEVQEKNAKLAARQAEQVGMQADNERQQLRNRMLLASGQARSSYAANGVVLGAGSAADYEADIADAYDMDSRNLEYDVAMRQWKLKVEAGNATDQASLYRAQASAYQSSQTTSLLSGMFNTGANTLNATNTFLSLREKLA